MRVHTSAPPIPPHLRDYDGCLVFRHGTWMTIEDADYLDNWTDADEAGLEQYEEDRRQRIAEANEY